jgi:hypothetical protein
VWRSRERKFARGPSVEVIKEPQGGRSRIVGLGLPSDIACDSVSTRITAGKHYGDQAVLGLTTNGRSELGIHDDPVAKRAAAAGPVGRNLGSILPLSGAFSGPVGLDEAGFAGSKLLGAMHGYWPGGRTTCVLEINPSDGDSDVGQIPAPARRCSGQSARG